MISKSILTFFILFTFLSTGCVKDDFVEIEKSEPIEAVFIEPFINTLVTEIPEEEKEEELVMYYTEQDVVALAKVLYRECGAIPSDIEKACVAWVACNHVDAGFGDTIYDVVTIPNHFTYIENTPVTDELYNLALDVLTRWNNEKNGIEDVGRVLPSDYLFFHGDGWHNYFRNVYSGGISWDYSLENPYED